MIKITEEYLKNAIYSKPITATNKWQKVAVPFTYNENDLITILINGQYINLNPNEVDIEFIDPCIIETEIYNGIEKFGTFPAPLKSIVKNEDYSLLTLLNLEETNKVRLSNINWSGLDTIDKLIIQGISLHLNVNVDTECIIYARLNTSNGKVGERSITLPSDSQEIVLGGDFDLWGLQHKDLLDFSDLSIDLIISDPFTSDVFCEINNAKVSIHYITNVYESIGFSIDGEHTKYYNVFLNDLTLDAGTKNEVKYHDLDGVDKTLAYRSNVKAKEIELEFCVDGDSLEEAYLYLERISKLLKNERDVNGKPIPKKITFDHILGKEWEYVMEGVIDVTHFPNDYSCKAKLKIPTGTSQSTDYKVTSTAGNNEGLTRVSPMVQVLCLANEVTLVESITNQMWSIRESSLVGGDILNIDCEKRLVTKVHKNATGEQIVTDVTSSVDFDSDWFSIAGEYRFEGASSCIVQKVKYKENW